MARPKKDGTYVNFLMAQDLFDRLVVYTEETQRTKTAAVEMALREFLDKYEQEKLNK